MSSLEAPNRSVATGTGAALAAPLRRPGARPAPVVEPRHLRVVAPAERVRRRLTPVAGVLLTALLFVTLFLIAIAHTLLVQGQIRLDDLDAQLTVEQARYQELRKEVAGMESPTRVVAAAHELGMVSPDDLVYLQPDMPDPGTGRSVEERQEPDPAMAAAEAVAAGSTWSVMKPLLGTTP